MVGNRYIATGEIMRDLPCGRLYHCSKRSSYYTLLYCTVLEFIGYTSGVPHSHQTNSLVSVAMFYHLGLRLFPPVSTLPFACW